MFVRQLFSSFLIACALLSAASAQVIINEIHYHPVEKARFNSSGAPIFQDTNQPADLSDDVHEFVELFNAGTSAVNLTGWKLKGGIDFAFPNGTSIAAGGLRVVAKNPARLQTVYGIASVLGPYTGKLSNNGDTVKLADAGGGTVESVSYGTNFPWAISANALGVADEFTGRNSDNYQYKGRSLQRVSATTSGNDPANWVAVRPASGPTPFADLPTPGAANIVTRAVPKPVVLAYSATQLSDGATIIRSNQQVRINCSFSSEVSLSNVQVESFVDNVSAFNEARVTTPMTALGTGQYTATLPVRPDRSIVRYRIKADRGDGLEVVGPRADDPAIVPVGAPTYQVSPPLFISGAREPWYAYFVTPVRSSTKQIYDVLVSTDGSFVDDNASTNTQPFNGLNGFQAMAYDCKGNPKRATAQTITGLPRETPYVLPTDRLWNDSVPGVFVNNGQVRDIMIRFHGSRYNRRPSRKSFKVFFPDYLPYRDGAGNEVTSIFETDKGDAFMTAHGLHQLAGLPLSTVRYVDWYFNNEGLLTRLEQGEYNGELLEAYSDKMQRLNPGSVREEVGEYYKSIGYIISPNTAGEGPYGSGNAWRLPASGPWTELQRFAYTFTLQNHGWKGTVPMRDLVNSMWAARGDTYTSPNPNLTTLRTWFQANWDVETELTSMTLGNWMTPWDDTTQNHFLWRRANGKWVRLLWDFDAMYGTGDNTGTGSSIYLGEVGLPSVFPGNNFRGPNYIKDSFIKAFRTEFKQRMWFLNNTLLDPENLQTLTYIQSGGAANTYYAYINGLGNSFATGRFSEVNNQVALGTFYKPNRPTAVAPASGAAVLPGASFTSSGYGYSAAFTHATAPSVSPHTFSKWEIRASNDTYDNPVYIATRPAPNLTSLPIPFGQLTFGRSYFWRVTYIDALGHPSITSAERSFSYGPVSGTAGNMVLNEIMADNHAAVPYGGNHPDYVELKNNTVATIDISGWGLTDNELVPNKYVFPANTTVPAGGYLIIWCDNNTTLPGLHAGFELSHHGQRVLLVQGGTVRDGVTFGPQTTDVPLGRIADGTGAWTLVEPSPGATNTARAFSTNASSVKINEWMADPVGGDDWFELFNPDATPIALAGLWLSDELATPKITQIPPLSFIGPAQFARFKADGTTGGFDSVNFKLSAGGDNVVLSASNGVATLDSVTFGAQSRGTSQGRFPDGAANIADFPQSPSPEFSNWLPASIVINEALSNSSAPLEDAIELFNPTSSAVDLSGWWLSDDKTSLQKFALPPGTIISPGGHVVLYENQFNTGGNAFTLSSTGDELILSAVDGVGALTGYRSQVSFGAAADGVSFGRVLTGNPPGSLTPEFWPMIARTFGQENSAPKTGPIIINEVMYHPPDIAGADNARDEFIELHNITTASQDVSGWRLEGDAEFTFAPGTAIQPGGYVLLVTFNPATDAASLNAFFQAYNLAGSTVVYGPFSPKLGNDAGNIELALPGPPVGGVAPYILVDKIEYLDGTPWPGAADGSGYSLQRASREMIGNDVANWSAAPPTPGRVNAGQVPLGDSDGDGIPDTWEVAHGFDPGSPADASEDADGDGRSNFAEYLAGTDPRNAMSVFDASVEKIAGGFRIEFTAQAGKDYTIQCRDALGMGGWTKLIDIAAPGSTQSVSYDDLTALAQRFYRVVTPMTP